MTAAQLIGKLGAAGIKLWLDEEKQLRFKAPKGALTAILKDQLIANKPAVIAFLADAKGKKLSDTIPRLNRDKDQEYSLSFAQQRFWFLDRLEPGNPSLHIPAAIHIKGALDIKLMRKSFDILAERHESLRSYFVIDEQQQVLQKIDTKIQWQLEENYDLSHLSQKDADERIQEIMLEEALRPFDLNKVGNGKCRFLRTRLARLSPLSDNGTLNSETILFINMHHIIADGWSISVLIHELSVIYAALKKQKNHGLAPLDIQYVDFAQWQRKWMQSEHMQTQLDYWKTELDSVPVLELPSDFIRPKQTTHHGSNIHFTIDAATSAAIKNLAQQQKSSLFSTLLSAFNILLFRHTGQSDFAVGTPVAGRNRQDIEKIIGCFINLLALRTQIDSQLSFNNYLACVQKKLLCAFDHQDLPFERIADEFSANRSLAHSPLFQVMFTMQAGADISLNMENLQLKFLPQTSHTAKYDLQLHIDESGESLACDIEFNTDLFTEDYIQDLGRHFTHLLKSISSNPEQSIALLDILDQQDIALLQLESPDSQTDKDPTNLLERLQLRLDKTPTGTAVSCGEKSLSFEQLHHQSDQLAQQLKNLGIRHHDRVGFCLPADIPSIISLLAIIKCGAAYVPMDANYPDDRLQHMMNNAELACVITDTDNAAIFDNAKQLILLDKIDLTTPMPATQSRHAIATAIDEKAALYLIFTSGSTGTPKAAAVSYANEINLLNWYAPHYGMTSDDKVLIISSLSFDLTQKNILAALISGAEIVFSPAKNYDPQVICKTIYEKQVSFINCAPSAFYPLLENCQRIDRLKYLRSSKHILLGGEAIDLEKFSPWIHSSHFNAQISNMYGPTECTDITCTYTLDNAKQWLKSNKPLPIGQVIPGVNIRVLDAQLQPVPIGSSGELYIAGKSVGLGYFQQDALNQESFIHDPFGTDVDAKMYRTHDVVRQYKTDTGLQLEFISRSDDQIKIRGFRVELGEISAQINQYQGILESRVFADKDSQGNQRLLAYYIQKTVGKNIDLHDLRLQLKRQLPDYMIPAAFISIETWPLSPNGKINKKALPEPQQHHSVKAEFIAASTSSELELTEIWQQFLSVDNIGIHDNFFELGGHSLIATRMIAQISKTFGIDIALKDFFEQATIVELAALIEHGGNLDGRTQLPSIQACDRSAAVPLSLAQERLWIIEQLNPGNAAYNIPVALTFTGALNVQALKKSLSCIVERHESLRTCIQVNHTGMAYQVISDSSDFTCLTTDLRAEVNAENTALEVAQKRVNLEANKAFACDNDVLFRAELITLADDQWLLMATMHHLISDGWSIALLQKELSSLYHAFVAGEENPLAPLAYQYADFSHWQRNNMQGEHLQLHLDYWLEQLHDAPAVIQLPSDRPRGEQQTFNGAMLSQDLSLDLSDKLKTFCQNYGTTAFNTLMSVYALLLSKYAKQHDICIGTPVSGRENADLQDIIGYFVNAVVIRNRLTGNPNILQLIQRTQDSCLGAFAHQNVPIEQILDVLPLERNLSYAPVAQTGFSFISDDFTQSLELDNVTIKNLDFERVVAKYELTCIVVDKGEKLNINFEYNTDLYNKNTIESMLNHFITLLEHCLNAPDSHINAIDLLNQDELIDALKLQGKKIDSIQPLTAMQHDMVLAQMLNPDSLANTLGYHAEVNFNVDADLWQSALQKVSNAQAITRTEFHNNHFKYGEFVYQAVLSKMHIQLEILDYSQQELDEKTQQKIVHDFIYQPHQYTKNTFIRYGLMRLTGDKTILLLSAHHALLDGISVVWIAQQTAAVYEALHHDQDYTQHCISTYDFSHYIEHNRQIMDNSKVRNFWQQAFKSCEASDFSADTLLAKSATAQARQIVKQHRISKETWTALQGYCRKNKTTPPQLFKLLYALLIGNYCRTEADFHLTDFHTGRDKNTAFELGCFFQQSPFIMPNALCQAATPIKSLLTYASRFRKEIKAVNNISAGLSHELAPVGRLQFMYNYYHFFPQDAQMLGHDVHCIEKPPFVDGAVQLVLKEQPDHMLLDLYYQDHLFDDKKFLPRLEALCTQLIKGAETVGELKIALKAEKMQQIYDWNHSIDHHDETPIKTLQQRFEAQVNLTPNAIAIIDDENTISYRELNNRSNQLARYLHNIGVGSDVRVGVCLPRSIDAMVAILAILKSGGAYVPIDSNYPQQRIQTILEAGKIHVLLSYKNLKPLYAQYHGETICLDGSEDDKHRPSIQMQSLDNLKPSNEADDLFYVIFTSGSTGQPKGATVTHKGVCNLQDWYCKEFDFNENSRVLIISALGFDLTQKNLFAPLMTGGQLILTAMDNYDSGAIHSLIEQHKVSLVNCAPSAFYPLVEDHPSYASLASLKTVILGGESIKLQRIKAWIESTEFNAEIINNYGPTECTDIASFYRIKNPAQYFDKPIPLGKPNTHVQVYILNNNQKLLPQGLIGEICIAGLGVGRGYLNHDELNHEKFIANTFGPGQLYRSGDLGYLDHKGHLFFVSRQDFQIKLNGLRIELGEIEQALQQQESVIESLVILKNDQLTAYLLSDTDSCDSGDIPSQLAQSLPSYMIPSHFVWLKKWPLNANGKINRNLLPEPEKTITQVEYIAPRDDIEAAICHIIAGILNLEKVGIYDNFFDLGGHSLAASRAIVQIREHFKIDIPLNVLFDMTSAEKLAAYIKANQWATQSAKQSQQENTEETPRDTGFI
ncbi:MAG: amino acid adenylation domain-containing protein [Pseudomonadales bacterium]|nr:amino acid adenylation domain-containing protein [Pseudomonadales bacterium]